jgi:ABC-type glycerol-3-phosphate transport system substrate-binding protein
VTKFPQIEGNPPTNINFANYWVEVVSKKSDKQNEAWDFLQFITQADQAKLYLAKTNRPTALRSLINEQKQNGEIGVFADQVLTAKSWYKGKNVAAAEEALQEMINVILSNTGEKMQNIINIAASKVQQTIK